MSSSANWNYSKNIDKMETNERLIEEQEDTSSEIIINNGRS